MYGLDVIESLNRKVEAELRAERERKEREIRSKIADELREGFKKFEVKNNVQK